MSTSQWMRWNNSSFILELSTDFGVTWSPLDLDASVITQGIIGSIARIATGTPTGSKFVRDDLTLAVPAGTPTTDASLLTTGVVALARGGTAVDLSATGGTHKILAQDASHVISARDFTAADIISGLLGLALGGTHTDLSATGGTGKFLKQATAGSDITVVQPTAADLSDYSTGTWTPSDASGGGITITNNSSWYVRIGKLVVAKFYVKYGSNISAVPAILGGLPFACSNDSGGVAGGYAAGFIDTGIGITLSAYAVSNTSTLQFYGNPAASVANSTLSNANIGGVLIYKTT